MGKRRSEATRVAGDVVQAAEQVAPARSRSTAGQVTHWARLGMELERADTAGQRRLAAVAAGEAPFASLSDAERRLAHALVDAAIADTASRSSFGRAARREGLATVALDEDGQLVRMESDGSRTAL